MNRLLILAMLIAMASCKNETSKMEAVNTDDIPGYEAGALLYQDFCLQCHLDQGQGVAKTFPPLAGSEWLTEKREGGIRAVKYGQRGAIEVMGAPYNGIMPPMGLTDQEVADVMNYIMNSWGNKSTQLVTVEEVAAVNK